MIINNNKTRSLRQDLNMLVDNLASQDLLKQSSPMNTSKMPAALAGQAKNLEHNISASNMWRIKQHKVASGGGYSTEEQYSPEL